MERAVKTPLQPGRGLMDWIRLCQQNPNMGGNDGVPIRVTDADMAEHAEQENAWMIINGKRFRRSLGTGVFERSMTRNGNQRVG